MPDPIVDPQGLSTPDTEVSWFDDLHDDYKAEKSLEVFSKDKEGLNNVVKSYLETKKKQGNAIWIPGDNATMDEVQDYRKKLGVPESPDKFDIKYKEHEAIKFDEGFDKAWKTKAHEVGLTPKQAQALTDYYADMVIGANDAQVKSYNDAVESMKQEYGNDYQTVLDKANKVLRTFADEKDMENIRPFENDIRLVKLLAKVGDAMSESTFKKGEQQTPEGTKEDMMVKIAELQAIYTDESRPLSQRKAADESARQLMARIHGDVQVSSSNQMVWK